MNPGDIVLNKLTGEQMVVILAGVVLPNFPMPLYRCRFQLPDGKFSVDHFIPEELIRYEEDIKTSSRRGDEPPEDVREDEGK